MEELQDNIKITIKTELNKTENKNDLINAMTNIIDIDYDVKNKEIIGKSTNYKKLINLHDRLRNKQTTHIARKVLMRNSDEDMTYILFNKQAAAIDSIVICENYSQSLFIAVRNSKSHRISTCNSVTMDFTCLFFK